MEVRRKVENVGVSSNAHCSEGIVFHRNPEPLAKKRDTSLGGRKFQACEDDDLDPRVLVILMAQAVHNDTKLARNKNVEGIVCKQAHADEESPDLKGAVVDRPNVGKEDLRMVSNASL